MIWLLLMRYDTGTAYLENVTKLGVESYPYSVICMKISYVYFLYSCNSMLKCCNCAACIFGDTCLKNLSLPQYQIWNCFLELRTPTYFKIVLFSVSKIFILLLNEVTIKTLKYLVKTMENQVRLLDCITGGPESTSDWQHVSLRWCVY